MPDRIERALRAVSYGLAALLLIQWVLLVARRNPLAGVTVPKPPRWTEPGERGATNAPSSPPTGSTPGPAALAKETSPIPAAGGATGPASGTNAAPAPSGTNAPGAAAAMASSPQPAGPSGTNGSTTNLPAASGTVAATNQGTLPGTTNPPPGSPATASARTRPAPPGGPFPGGPFPGGPGGPGRKPLRPPPPFSPVIQARMDRVTSSEMLAPVFRPPPMALIGIAGHHAFIRTPSGQTSMLREGGESDGIKLVRLGTNRVLIEQAGEKKELIIFNGLGSASLLTP